MLGYNALSNPKKIAVLAEAQNWRCAYCGIRCDGDVFSDRKATRDHVVPKAKLGQEFFSMDHWANEVMACSLCNNSRGAMWARKYFQRVQWVGREKAAKWASRQHSKKAKAKPAPPFACMAESR